jgi:hypothetical protein
MEDSQFVRMFPDFVLSSGRSENGTVVGKINIVTITAAKF